MKTKAPQIILPEEKRVGVFGSSESGKTTLAIRISQQIFRNEKREAVILSPNDKDAVKKWHPGRVFRNEEQFWDFVFNVGENLLIVVDDASETIAKDKALTTVFISM